ncbi:MAG: hypothetical protein ABSG42_06640 [Nitrospirota bacterium]
MPFFVKVLILIAAALLMNLPLGYMRQGVRKLSLAWFVSVHASIPFIILLRVFWLKISYWYIPFSLGFAVVGQIIGGRMRKPQAERTDA